MFSSQKLNQITGLVLAGLTIASAALGMCGVWGLVDDETGTRLFMSFIITAVTTGCVAAIADKFWKSEKQEGR